jgi:hypothetical protein
MKKTTLAALAAACMLGGAAHAQMFGDAANWQRKDEQPDVRDGVVHLRFGLAATAEGLHMGGGPPAKAHGNANCDIDYLYAAKSGVPLKADTLKECALMEYKLANRWSNDSINALRNAYTEQEALNKFVPVIEQRIALFRSARRFYARPGGVQVGPANVAQGTFDLDMDILDDIQGSRSGNLIVLQHRNVNRYRFGIRVPADPGLGREIEFARLNGLLYAGASEIQFDVVGVGTVRLGPIDYKSVRIENIGWKIQYGDAAGKLQNIGTY